MSLANNGYKYSYKQSKHMTLKAVRMAGNALDLMHPSPEFKWRGYAESMLDSWKKEDINYQLLVEMESDVLLYCLEELSDYVAFYARLK